MSLNALTTTATNLLTGYNNTTLLVISYVTIVTFLFLYRWTCSRVEKANGKSVYITGGSTGIGLSVAKEYAKLGANICIFARTESKLIKAVKEIKECTINEEQQIIFVSMDVTKF